MGVISRPFPSPQAAGVQTEPAAWLCVRRILLDSSDSRVIVDAINHLGRRLQADVPVHTRCCGFVRRCSHMSEEQSPKHDRIPIRARFVRDSFHLLRRHPATVALRHRPDTEPALSNGSGRRAVKPLISGLGSGFRTGKSRAATADAPDAFGQKGNNSPTPAVRAGFRGRKSYIQAVV
jgi:hypothetical protein